MRQFLKRCHWGSSQQLLLAQIYILRHADIYTFLREHKTLTSDCRSGFAFSLNIKKFHIAVHLSQQATNQERPFSLWSGSFHFYYFHMYRKKQNKETDVSPEPH